MTVHVKQLKGADEIIAQATFVKDEIRPYISFNQDTQSLEFHTPIKVSRDNNGHLPDFSQLSEADFVNKKYVDTEITNLKNGVSTQFDTLKEIEDALKTILFSGGGVEGSGQVILANVETAHDEGIPIGSVKINDNEYIFKVDLQTLLSNISDPLRFSKMPEIVHGETILEGDESDHHFATTAFVHQLINSLKDGVKSELNTLDRIAYAINNDPMFFKHVSEEISNATSGKFGIDDISISVPDIDDATVIGTIYLKGANYEFKVNLKPFARLDSPIFQGTPIVPDIDDLDNDTSQAVNAKFVQQVVDDKVSTAVSDIKGNNPAYNTLAEISTVVDEWNENLSSYKTSNNQKISSLESSISSVGDSIKTIETSGGSVELSDGLQSISDLSVAKNRILYTTGLNKYSSTSLTETGRALLNKSTEDDIREYLNVPAIDYPYLFDQWTVNSALNDGDGLNISSTYAKQKDIQNVDVTTYVNQGTTLANIKVGNNNYDINVNLESYAPINSAILQGEPTAPTPDSLDSTTKIATTAFVHNVINSKIGELVDNAPDNLNTLNELANALSGDAAFSSTVVSLISDKQKGSTALTALSSYASTSNKIVYTNGTGTYKTTDISDFARNSLLTAASVTELKNNLGVTGSNINPSTSNVSLKVDLESNQAQLFNGSESATNIGVTGILPVTNGGTGSDNLDSITVGSAVRDSEGSVISESYAKLSGANFTGNLELWEPAKFEDLTYYDESSHDILISNFGYVGSRKYDAGMQVLNDISTDSEHPAHDIILLGNGRLLLYSGNYVNRFYNNTVAGAHSIGASDVSQHLYILSDNGITFKTNISSDFSNVKTMTFDNGVLTVDSLQGTATAAVKDSEDHVIKNYYLSKEEASTSFATLDTVTGTKAGLVPPLEGVSTKFLNSKGQWVTVTATEPESGSTITAYNEGQGISIKEGIISLEAATDGNLGGVKLSSTVTVNSEGQLTVPVATTLASGLMSTSNVSKLVGITEGAEPNAINTIKINGVPQTPDATKAIDITIPDVSSKVDEVTLSQYVMKDNNKVLSDVNYSNDDYNKLQSIESGATKNTAGTNVSIVNGQINVATGSKTSLGVLKVGSNIGYANGVISIGTAEIVSALNYTPANQNDLPTTMTGASETSWGSSGLTPQVPPGAQNFFLKGDGSWADPGVTSTIPASSTNTDYSAGAGLALVNNTFSITKASDTQLGGIKLGNGVSVDSEGVISVRAATSSQNGLMTANHVKTLTSLENSIAGYQVPKATTTNLGEVIIGDGISVNADGKIALKTATSTAVGGVKLGNNVTVDSSGKISVKSASSSDKGLMSSDDYDKLNGIEDNAQINVLEKVSVNNKELTITKKGVNIDISGKADNSVVAEVKNNSFVSVSVSGQKLTFTKGDNTSVTLNTQDTNTKYSAASGTGISINGATISGIKGSSVAPGILQVGNNISVNNGIISLTKENVTNALTYTPANSTDIPSVMTGATASKNGTAGLVPAPVVSQRALFLSGNGDWEEPINTDTKYTVASGTGISLDNTIISGKTASNNEIGMVKVAAVSSSNISLNSNGAISVPLASSTQAGVIKLNGNAGYFLRGDNNWTVPANDKVAQSIGTALNGTYPILLTPTKNATADVAATNVIFDSKVKVNPSLGTIYAPNISVSGNVSLKAGSMVGMTHTNGQFISGLKMINYNSDKGAEMLVTAGQRLLVGSGELLSYMVEFANSSSDSVYSYLNTTEYPYNESTFIGSDGHIFFITNGVSYPDTPTGIKKFVMGSSGSMTVPGSVSASGFIGNVDNAKEADTAVSLKTGRSFKVSLNSNSASSNFDGTSNINNIGVTGTLPVANGGTGITVNPSMLVNLNATVTANVFSNLPRPGVTGTLSPAHGGTGTNNLANVSVGTASKAISLNSTPTINGIPFNGTNSIVLSATCTTTAATAAKVVTVNGVSTPVADAVFAITFSAVNTVNNPTLSINGDVRSLYKDGQKITTSNVQFTNAPYQTVFVKAMTIPVATGGFAKNEKAWAIIENTIVLSSDLVQGVLPVTKGGTGQTGLSAMKVGSATTDGDGNTISSTYAKLKGAAFKGKITAPSVTTGAATVSNISVSSVSAHTVTGTINFSNAGIIKSPSTLQLITAADSTNATYSFSNDVLQIPGKIAVSVPTADSLTTIFQSTIAGSDYFRIGVGGASNAGTAEIAVADDGNESIYVRKYKNKAWNSDSVVAELALLDSSNNTKINNALYLTNLNLIGGSNFTVKDLGENDSVNTKNGNNVLIHAGNNLFIGAGEAVNHAIERAGNYIASEESIRNPHNYQLPPTANLVTEESLKSVLRPDFRFWSDEREDVVIMSNDGVYIYTQGHFYQKSNWSGASGYPILTAAFEGEVLSAITGNFSKDVSAVGGTFSGAITADSLSTFNNGINAKGKSTIANGKLTKATISAPNITGTATLTNATATHVTVANATATNVTVANATATNVTVANATATDVTVANATVSTATVKNATVTGTLNVASLTGSCIFGTNEIKGSLQYDNTENRNKLLSVSAIAHWGGQINSNSTVSNLTYCRHGEFGDIVTANKSLMPAMTVNTASIGAKGITGTILGTVAGSAAGSMWLV